MSSSFAPAWGSACCAILLLAAGSALAQQPPAPAAPATTSAVSGAPAAPVVPDGSVPASTVADPAEASPAAVAATAPPSAGEGGQPVDTRGIDEQTQALKKEAVDLNRELFMLEEELLFPANTQVAVFLSMDVGEFFALDSVQLKVDNHEVSNYLYTQREAEALLKGGVQRLYLGNLKVGDHEIVAIFNGKGPNERDYRRGATLQFAKAVGAKYLELKITDSQRRGQPEFEIKDWE
jgi:hypothetical protein